MNNRTIAVIVAAGSSARMGHNKILADLCGKPVLAYSLAAFQAAESVDDIIIVTSDGCIDAVKAISADFPKVTQVVSGGKDRVQSVINGINAITDNDGIVAVHDGARPLIAPPIIDEAINTVKALPISEAAAIVAVPVKDTVKCTDNKVITATVNRSGLYAAQTPQVFGLRLYRDIIANMPNAKTLDITDDSMLFEAAGIKVKIVEGSYSNIKITTPEDLLIAEVLIKQWNL